MKQLTSRANMVTHLPSKPVLGTRGQEGTAAADAAHLRACPGAPACWQPRPAAAQASAATTMPATAQAVSAQIGIKVKRNNSNALPGRRRL